MRITLLGADLGASLATHAVGHVGDGHDLLVVFGIIVVETHDLSALVDPDHLQHLASAHLVAAATANALFLVDELDEFGGPNLSSREGYSEFAHPRLLATAGFSEFVQFAIGLIGFFRDF